MTQHAPSGFIRARRWLVPVAALAAIAGGVAVNQAAAEPPLPAKTAEQLLTDLQRPTLEAFSGTVTSTVDLGLPARPGGEDATQLLSGTHTVRIWSDGDAQKVAIADGTDEWSTVRNGNTVWTWSSAEQKAVKTTVAQGERTARKREIPSGVPRTPQEAAARALAALEPSTDVSTSRTTTVAGRAAYELVLRPTSPGTLVEQVSIAVDATTNMALRVQTWAVDVDDPVIDIGYTRFDDSAPDASVFDFTPPPGAEVTEKTVTPGKGEKGEKGGLPPVERPQVVGEGWSTVMIATLPERAGRGGDSEAAQQWQRTLAQLPTVSGQWGSGKLLQSNLFSIVITDDNRIAVGAVDSDTVVGAIR